MPDQRKEPRQPESLLPTEFRRLLVYVGETAFVCRAVDAGANGLGLIAGKSHQSAITRGQTVKVAFENFVLDAEVLHVFETFGPQTFRFGVHLNKYFQLKPYWALLGPGIRA